MLLTEQKNLKSLHRHLLNELISIRDTVRVDCNYSHLHEFENQQWLITYDEERTIKKYTCFINSLVFTTITIGR